MTKHVGIMGCGWLGLPLAQHLKEQGYQVSGTTTSPEKIEVLQSIGINTYHIHLTEQKIKGNIEDFLDNIDSIIINIPPSLKKNPNDDFLKKMQLLYHEIVKSRISQVLFVSSTSVYGDRKGVITEETQSNPISKSGKQLLASELLFRQNLNIKTTIVRFGGLIGPDRHPVYHLSGKKDLQNGNDLVNLIHLDDCIHILKTIVEQKYWGMLFNGVYPYHPTKKEYYTKEALKRKLKPPSYREPSDKSIQKTIKSKNFLTKNHSLYTSISS